MRLPAPKIVTLLVCLAFVLLDRAQSFADYPDWPHSGSIFLLTTPEGANLPATAVEENVPVLIHLHRDFFDFKAAKPDGADIRFSLDGENLAYQIEQWDPQAGTASIWVRIPKVLGNTRHELKIYWGNSAASSESNGQAVFNDSNNFLSVLHMDEALIDEVGTIKTKNVQTSTTGGLIGQARRLEVGQGIVCGEENDGFPVGASSHSTEAWIRPSQSNGRALALSLIHI